MPRALLLLAACAMAASPPPKQISIPVWIEDGPAAAPGFGALLNNRSAEIARRLGPSSDQIILVILDVSGDVSLVDPARQSLVSEIGKLPSNAWVGLMSAQDGLHVLADPSPDRARATEAIEDQPSSGNPGLLETVQSALEIGDAMSRKAPVRVSVLYVTDSNVQRYREDYTNPVINQSDPHDLSRRFPEALVEEKISRLVDAVAPLEAPLFVVHLHYRSDRLNRAYQNGLGTLAESTGGRAVICRSVAEIPEAISAMFDRISSAWRLTLIVPPKVHGLAQVRLDGGERRLSWRTHVQVR